MKIGQNNSIAVNPPAQMTSGVDALTRFQQARETALHRLGNGDAKQKLEQLIREKKSSGMAAGKQQTTNVMPAASTTINAGEGVSKVIGNTLQKASELLLYTNEPETAPVKSGRKILGNYIDMVA
ncbi:MAG: hypothetical protein HQK83_08490 [Fibrobacteria bacterium]|nr:hypothetical protein [Fibrobacteria bacterium]